MLTPSNSDDEKSCQALHYDFGRFALDVVALELRREGRPVSLSPQAARLLVHLVQNRERTVTRDELLGAGWGDSVVSEVSLRVAIHELRAVFGDLDDVRRFIRTERSSGYRFVAPVRVAQPRRAAHAQSDDSLPAQPASPVLHGRDRELAELRAIVSSARERGCACVLVGPPGVGKTRLALEALSLARREGAITVESHAEPDHCAEPFAVWTALISRRLQHASAALRARCERVAPTAVRLLLAPAGERALNKYQTPEQLRSSIFDELTELLFALADEQALVLLLDDLHWADEASLAFFGHFARCVSRGPVLLLATCRPLPAREHRALARALEAAARAPENSTLELSNLSVEAVAGLLSAAGPTAERDTAAQIHALTQGNPLFSLQLAELLGAGLAKLDAPPMPGLPSQLPALVRRRLSALPEHCRATLLSASVLGADFTVGELAAIMRVPPGEALARVDLCLDCGVLVRHVGQRIGFPHPLLREVAYGALRESERSALHLTIADFLEQHGPSTSNSDLAKLAHHYYRAAPGGAGDKAASYAARCAALAMQSGAYASAVTHYDHALEYAPLSPRFCAHARLGLEIDRATAQLAAGVGGDVTARLHELAERADALGYADLLARAALAHSGLTRAGFSPNHFADASHVAAGELLERALTAISDAPSEVRVLLQCALAWALMSTPERARREQLCDEAVAGARSLRMPWLEARALLARIYVCAAPDRHEARLTTCDELVALVQQRGLTELEVEARVARAICLLEVCDTAAAQRDEARALLLAQARRSPALRARAEVLELLRLTARGELSLAEQLAQRALAESPRDLIARSMFVARMATFGTLQRGYARESVVWLESMLVQHPHALGLRCMLASSYAHFGDDAPAREQFDLVTRDDWRALPEDINWLPSMGYLADAAVHLSDPARAALVYDKLAPHGQRWVFYGGEAVPAGPAAHWLGQLATTRGDGATAADWLACARALCVRMRAPLFLQFNAIAEARRIMLCGPAHDVPRAERLLAEVLAFADAHRLAALRAHAEPVQALLRGHVRGVIQLRRQAR
jgi:DNA-binding winged helix-turn-helix (wHTH) protein/tetratricopeptide (TPR) repeat protein